MFYSPTVALKSILSIDKELLEKYSIKGLILDVDNTLTTHNNPNPADGVMDWIDEMKKSGIKLCIVSNNKYARVKPFAEMLDIPFIASGAKPFATGNNKAVELMKLPKENIAAVGDQLFTDIWGGHSAKIKTIYVCPIEFEKNFFFKCKRLLEKPFLRKINSSIEK